jgi:hypothetical protein
MKHTEGRLGLRDAHPDCKFYRELGHDDSENGVVVELRGLSDTSSRLR